MRRTNLILSSILATSLLSACGGGGGSSNGGGGGVGPVKATLNGTFTFEYVPHNTVTNGLDYASTREKPARGVTVEVLNAANSVVATTTTDESGRYSFQLDPGVSYTVRGKAELVKTGQPSWDVSITDNTSVGMPLYAATGSLAALPSGGQTRNLVAKSGWSASSQAYTSARVAAPFAILDPIYEAMKKMSAADSAIAFPSVEFRWSTKNTSSSGNVEDGNIGTSSYQSDGTTGNVYVLGDANNDTDEYDSHVIVHEWGHYFQDRLSRDNSVGGSHSGGQRLDPRVAFSEGWGNALSAMVLDDPIYRDSLGTAQASGFSINVESNTTSNQGWFNEASVQSILYDIYDSAADGPDSIATGLGPIYKTLTSTTYLQSPYFSTIFSFSDAFRGVSPTNASGLDALLSAQSINGTGANGSGETNNGGVPTALPLYKEATLNRPAIEVCSLDDLGNYNKLGNRTFVYVNLPSAGSYTLTATRKSGAANTDPDFFVYQGSDFYGWANSSEVNTETATYSLPAGGIVVDVHDWNNADGEGNNSGDACFDFTITN